ncbi:hypothetical protein ONE63_011117 [Megalurothrips usitatus]|uniref:52 kDa repressor of the inhibitor of the protein kinase-like n=1 Tax=Megalurothrips usitatus TaxID=439358 RepID=A0AAV7XH07_9NEOP|nr:hypothetical protein ONE63_011117 [Megalurothrips usitatus]
MASGGSAGAGRKRPQPQVTLHSFFAKKKTGERELDANGDGVEGAGVAVERGAAASVSACARPHASGDDGYGCSVPVATVPVEIESGEGYNGLRGDIGHHIGKKRPDDFTVFKILTAEQVTLDANNLPYSLHKKQNKIEKRYLNQDHLKKFKGWLVYSPAKEGLFCKFCPFFVPGKVRGGVALKGLVTEPVKNYAKILGTDGTLESHSRTAYHMDAVLAGQDFLHTFKNPNGEISNQLETRRLADLEEKKVLVKKIIETIILCGRQNFALRGHRDSGKLTLDSPDHNDGNLRSLLRFRASVGDDVLKQKISDGNSKLKYVSPTHQNEFIHFCGQEIQSSIRTKVLAARFFAIMFDESPDISHISQMSLVLRYVDCTDPKKIEVREDFVMFIDARQAAADMLIAAEEERGENEEAYLDDDLREEDDNRRRCSEPILSGEVIGKVAIKAVVEVLGLDMDNCVAVSTDSCSVMMSEAKGAVAQVLKVAKHAVKTPCGSHTLNNSLSQSSKVQHVKTTSTVIQHTSTFMNSSSKRNYLVREILKKSGMPKLCETRFIERHDAYLLFRDNISSVVEVLQEVMGWRESKASADAQSLILSITNPAFVVTLVCISSEHINDVISSLEEKRRQADENFSVLFLEAVEILEKIGGEMKTPRVFRRSRPGHPADDDPETYFRQSVYIPILDAISEDIRERFCEDTLQAYGLSCLLPKFLLSSEFLAEAREKQSGAIAAKYWSLFASSERSFLQMFRAELNLWQRKWSRVDKADIPVNVVASIEACDSQMFPLVSGLLRILCTLPSSTCTAERSFSTLRRLKTYLRNTMIADRLTGLSLLNIHRGIAVSTDAVLERFLKSEKRRL